MKKITLFLLGIFITVNLFSQNPKEIIDKCVKALGGEEVVKKFFDYKAEGEMKIFYRGMGLSGEMKLIQKKKKSYTKGKITFGKDVFTFIRAYDGKKAWMERMGTVVDQPSLNNESELDHTISLLLEKEATFSLSKETEIEGKKVIGVEVNFKGKKTTFFIDKENYLILEIVYKDLFYGEKKTKEMLKRRIRWEDYKKFSGVLFPSKITNYQKEKKFMELKFTHIIFTPKISTDIFKRPDQKLDLRYMEERLH